MILKLMYSFKLYTKLYTDGTFYRNIIIIFIVVITLYILLFTKYKISSMMECIVCIVCRV